jgi:GNAT superfamily N-acetyltransferase
MADVSVRPARGADAAEIARIQLSTWQIGYQEVLPSVILDQLAQPQAQAEAEQNWRAAVAEPPSPRHHVLVALEKDTLVGFVALSPADELAGEHPSAGATTLLGPLLVEPRWGRRGHGSRLLAAAIDHARTDVMTAALIWLPESDQVSIGFFVAAGWAQDGYARAFDTGAGQLRELRLHTSLSEDEEVA